jgi:hypothetical protein
MPPRPSLARPGRRLRYDRRASDGPRRAAGAARDPAGPPWLVLFMVVVGVLALLILIAEGGRR